MPSSSSSAERSPLLPGSRSSSKGRALADVRASLRQPLAELLGVFLIVLVGDGVVAQWVLSRGTHGSWLGLNVACEWSDRLKDGVRS